MKRNFRIEQNILIKNYTLYVKDYIDKGIVTCKYCPTEGMITDLLTKPLSIVKHTKLLKKCNVAKFLTCLNFIKIMNGFVGNLMLNSKKKFFCTLDLPMLTV